ncbi:MAG: tetraacyldisaccharide 4'-kinase [Planctomycetota bacterium]|jgi:tetraacyldisaccharide 4'-kinase
MPLSLLYALAMYIRRRMYARGLFPSVSFQTPILSVGNITVGGTGKTPAVLWLCEALLTAGHRPGVASRGYGAGSKGGSNDEEAMLKSAVPGALFSSHPQRTRAVQAVLDLGATVVILDDGFQHLRVQRDVDLVLLDTSSPSGGGACMPAGLLREGWGALSDADVLILTRSDQACPHELEALEARLQAEV